MEKKWLKTETPLDVAGVTIIPVVKTRLDYWSNKGGTSYLCSKEPVSVVVFSDSVKMALCIDGEEISIGELAAEIPDLQEMLEK